MENDSELSITKPTGIRLFKKLMREENDYQDNQEELSEDQQDQRILNHIKSVASRTKKKLKK